MDAADGVRAIGVASAARVVDLGALRHEMAAAHAERLIADVRGRLLLELPSAVKNVNEEAANRNILASKN